MKSCCPNCGGAWIGDGVSTPIHCENLDIEGLGLEPDADPTPCGRLKYAPSKGNPQSFVGIHEGCGGWNSVLFVWCPEGPGFYEPYQSGFNNTLGDGTKKSAIGEALNWGISEGVPVWFE